MATSALLTAASCIGVGAQAPNAATALMLATTAPVATAGSALILCQTSFMIPPWSCVYSPSEPARTVLIRVQARPLFISLAAQPKTRRLPAG